MIGYEIDNRFGEMIQKEIVSAKARFPDMKFEVISR
jgi:hypothetical protein